MKGTKKKSILHVRRNFLLLISALLLTLISCQQDEILIDPVSDADDQKYLKNSVIPTEYQGTYSGGDWLISLPVPDLWNNLENLSPPMPRVMVFYAHGIVDPVPYEPVQLPDDEIGGVPVKNLITSLWMGYATTSYRDNGLFVPDAVKDIQKLVDVVNKFFKDNPGFKPPDYLLLGGPSEGGLVTVLTIEKYPQLFDGAISICGPIGNFYDQLQYNGDFHVLFNYFFGNELAAYGLSEFGYPISIGNPQDGVDPVIMNAWKKKEPYLFDLQEIIVGLMTTFPERVPQLLNCANVPYDPIDPLAAGVVVLDMLRFNIMFTNDVIERMKGVPYNNIGKEYEGSLNDDSLNANVQRICDHSFLRARNFIRQYETCGRIAVPLVTIHNDGDHVVPFFHQEDYGSKIFPLRDDLLLQIDVDNTYWHCNIEVLHILQALEFIGEQVGVLNLTANASNIPHQ